MKLPKTTQTPYIYIYIFLLFCEACKGLHIIYINISYNKNIFYRKMIYHSPINTLPISLLLSKALLIAKMISESAFNIKSAFDSKSAFRYHFWMKKCKVGAFGRSILWACCTL